jgi:hypothetical protein
MEVQMGARLLFALGLLSFSTAAQAMTADTFYNKAVHLKKQGMAAIFSSDVTVLKKEMQAAVKSVKAENAAAAAKGVPLYCAPPKVAINSDEVITEFGNIPAQRRKNMSVRAAWREIAIRKYPC